MQYELKRNRALSDDDVKAIVSLLEHGVSVKELAERFKTEEWVVKVLSNMCELRTAAC